MTVAFFVAGTPATQGSKRGFVNPKNGRVIVTEDCERNKDWRAQVAYEAQRQAASCITGPVELRLAFKLKRPTGHYRTGKHADKLRDSAPSYPTTKPDTTKLQRCVEDALKGIVWRDDSQVVKIIAVKLYAQPWEHTGVSVMVSELNGDAADAAGGG